jgi:hypothetical protein
MFRQQAKPRAGVAKFLSDGEEIFVTDSRSLTEDKMFLGDSRQPDGVIYFSFEGPIHENRICPSLEQNEYDIFISLLVRAYSLVVRRYIRIVQARVRFSLGPQTKNPPNGGFFVRDTLNIT